MNLTKDEAIRLLDDIDNDIIQKLVALESVRHKNAQRAIEIYRRQRAAIRYAVEEMRIGEA